ncbi:MAG: DNA polymerase III subunit epsilon [Gammaproteobacteria bacterium]|nr:DNA polymerase III subunit epsilon [Gammaproteobacteria bacterium]MDE1887731.1 DNA polymerase III subunit epsilon [Gammaproteobacteria bacterium]MDE2023667.1 DNA polymerase III subunit epsilon [Gammaproteobacteria bacterium]MDE2139503.1 DNA polymerase III subunit epsilon [Gammaproteobacteria bacterium]MDE2273129.1 DNA polymerase III subunit epsilon [Gammaproteobacteria bacterium]
MRQIVLDTETTGLEPGEGHRIIEIGCVELLDRRITQRNFHQYINPERGVDAGAAEVHNLSEDFLAGKPRFAQIAAEFLRFVEGAELVIHNAAFDIAFLNSELRRLGDAQADITRQCRILDTLELARGLHPGQKNSLDALCKRYHVDNTAREYHGALLDAQLLAEVYLAMTGGQASLSLDASSGKSGARTATPLPVDRKGICLAVIRASDQELQAHRERLAAIRKRSGGKCLWSD